MRKFSANRSKFYSHISFVRKGDLIVRIRAHNFLNLFTITTFFHNLSDIRKTFPPPGALQIYNKFYKIRKKYIILGKNKFT